MISSKLCITLRMLWKKNKVLNIFFKFRSHCSVKQSKKNMQVLRALILQAKLQSSLGLRKKKKRKKKKIKKYILKANALLPDLELLQVFLNIFVLCTGRGETPNCRCLAWYFPCISSGPSREHRAAPYLQLSHKALAAAGETSNSELSKDGT